MKEVFKLDLNTDNVYANRNNTSIQSICIHYCAFTMNLIRTKPRSESEEKQWSSFCVSYLNLLRTAKEQLARIINLAVKLLINKKHWL